MADTELTTGPLVQTASLTTLHWLAVALALGTGLVHLYLGFVYGLAPFVLAGVGFLVGVVVFFTRYWRPWFYLVAALYAAVQVVLWLASGMRFFQLGFVDKVFQAALVLVVLYLYWDERPSAG